MEMNLHEMDPLPIIGVVLLLLPALLGIRRKYPNNPNIVAWFVAWNLIIFGCAIAFIFIGRLIPHQC